MFLSLYPFGYYIGWHFFLFAFFCILFATYIWYPLFLAEKEVISQEFAKCLQKLFKILAFITVLVSPLLFVAWGAVVLIVVAMALGIVFPAVSLVLFVIVAVSKKMNKNKLTLSSEISKKVNKNIIKLSVVVTIMIFCAAPLAVVLVSSALIPHVTFSEITYLKGDLFEMKEEFMKTEEFELAFYDYLKSEEGAMYIKGKRVDFENSVEMKLADPEYWSYYRNMFFESFWSKESSFDYLAYRHKNIIIRNNDVLQNFIATYSQIEPSITLTPAHVYYVHNELYELFLSESLDLATYEKLHPFFRDSKRCKKGKFFSVVSKCIYKNSDNRIFIIDFIDKDTSKQPNNGFVALPLRE